MIFDVFRQSLVVLRNLPGSYINQVWNDGLTIPFTITASVQPLNGIEMTTLPEGYRDKAAYKLYTASLLNTVNPGAIDPDIILFNGDKFVVIQVQAWQNNIIPHYEVLISKLDSDVT